MALPTASDNLWPKLIVRESADDGSDFSNPSADYRVLFVGEDGDLHLKDSGGTVTDFPAGGSAGGGVDWTQILNADGSSIAAFTAASGTWAAAGGKITQTDTTATHRRLRWDTKLNQGLPVIYEAKINFPSSGQGSSPDRAIGILLGYDGTNTNGMVVALREADDKVQWERDGITAVSTASVTVAQDTVYTLRVYRSGLLATAYVDGTLIGTANFVSVSARQDYAGLVTYGAKAEIDDFKIWTLSTGLPA